MDRQEPDKLATSGPAADSNVAAGSTGAAGSARAAWYEDPFGRHEQRWWDGGAWSEKVRTGQLTGIDPPGIDPQHSTPGASARVGPITDASAPVPLRSPHIPVVLLVGVLVLVAIVIIVVISLLMA